MQNTKDFLWTSWSLSALGFWLLFSPATFGYHSNILTWNSWVIGILLIFLGPVCRKKHCLWAPWMILFLGIWLQAAPLFFWAPDAACYLNDTFTGVWVIALSFVIRPLTSQTPYSTRNIPPGWSFNPSAWPQQLPVALLILLCWLSSRYLAAFQLGYIDTLWDPFFGNGTLHVVTSNVSKAFPISDAGLGALAYTIEFLATIQGGTGRWRTAPWMVAIFGILVIPVSLTSVILIILQPLVVKAWCSVCLFTAILMLIEIPFAIDEVYASYQFLRKAPKGTRLKLFFSGGECPLATEDHRTPALEASLTEIFRSSAWGVTCPWNLIFSAVLGACLMFFPRYFIVFNLMNDLDPILGALAVIFSVLACSEIFRNLRWANVPLAVLLTLLAIINLSSTALLAHLIIAALLAACALRKGPVRELFLWKTLHNTDRSI